MNNFIKRPWNLVDTKQDFLMEKLYTSLVELRNEVNKIKTNAGGTTSGPTLDGIASETIADIKLKVDSLSAQVEDLNDQLQGILMTISRLYV